MKYEYEMAKTKRDGFMPVATMLKFLWMMFLIVVFFEGVLLSIIPFAISGTIKRFASKSQEKQADLFACKIGLSDGLYDFLEYLSGHTYAENKLVTMFETHPSPRIRIGYIEEYRRTLI